MYKMEAKIDENHKVNYKNILGKSCTVQVSYRKKIVLHFIDEETRSNVRYKLGLAMAQAVSRRPPTAEARVRCWGSVHVGFVVYKVALGQVFPPSSSVFPCQFHSTGAPLLGKGQK
jgi:hypothetical protein